jgi:hypothetical protein
MQEINNDIDITQTNENTIMTEDEFYESCQIENSDIDIASVDFNIETAEIICNTFNISEYMAS